MPDPYRKPVLVVPPPGAEPKPALCPFPMKLWEGLQEWYRTDLPCGGCGGDISPVYAKLVTKDGRLMMRWPCRTCGAVNFTKTWEETTRDREKARRSLLHKSGPTSRWQRFVAWLERAILATGPAQD